MAVRVHRLERVRSEIVDEGHVVDVEVCVQRLDLVLFPFAHNDRAGVSAGAVTADRFANLAHDRAAPLVGRNVGMDPLRGRQTR